MDQIGGSDIFGDLSIDMESRNTLQAITKWAKISAIAGLVSSALSVLSTVSGITRGGTDQVTSMVVRAGLIFIIPVAVAMIVLNIFLLRFAASTSGGIANFSQSAFNMGISFLKMYFKTLGIIIIIAIGLVIIVMIAFVLGAAVGGR